MSGAANRLAGAHEAPLLAALHAASFPADFWDEPVFAKLLSETHCFALVISPDENPQGFILLRVAAGEAELLTLAVTPHFRKRGLAKALLQEGIAACGGRGASEIFLEVAEDNTAARALYALAGFAEVGRRLRYYGRPTGTADALILKRPL